MADLNTTVYSDHLAASGDAHQLYDLFPIPFTRAEVRRVSDRIRQVQDVLGQRLSVENTTWYTNIGELSEADFLAQVGRAGGLRHLAGPQQRDREPPEPRRARPDGLVQHIDLARVSDLHVAGHEWDERFGLDIDTHSQPVAPGTAEMARQLNQTHGIPILLEWDNDVPGMDVLNRELACLRPSMTL